MGSAGIPIQLSGLRAHSAGHECTESACGRPRRKHRVLKTIGILFLALILVAAVFEVTRVNDWIGYAYREYKRKAEKTGVREGLEKFVANHPNA